MERPAGESVGHGGGPFMEKEELATRSLNIQSVSFYLDVKQNDWGRFIKFAELAADGERKSCVFMLMRIANDFKELLQKVFIARNEESKKSSMPTVRKQSSKRDLHNSQSGMLHSERIVAEGQRYFFDLREDSRGRFLRITQNIGVEWPSIALPAEGMMQLAEALQELVDEFGEGYMEESPYFAGKARLAEKENAVQLQQGLRLHKQKRATLAPSRDPKRRRSWLPVCPKKANGLGDIRQMRKRGLEDEIAGEKSAEAIRRALLKYSTGPAASLDPEWLPNAIYMDKRREEDVLDRLADGEYYEETDLFINMGPSRNPKRRRRWLPSCPKKANAFLSDIRQMRKRGLEDEIAGLQSAEAIRRALLKYSTGPAASLAPEWLPNAIYMDKCREEDVLDRLADGEYYEETDLFINIGPSCDPKRRRSWLPVCPKKAKSADDIDRLADEEYYEKVDVDGDESASKPSPAGHRLALRQQGVHRQGEAARRLLHSAANSDDGRAPTSRPQFISGVVREEGDYAQAEGRAGCTRLAALDSEDPSTTIKLCCSIQAQRFASLTIHRPLDELLEDFISDPISRASIRASIVANPPMWPDPYLIVQFTAELPTQAPAAVNNPAQTVRDSFAATGLCVNLLMGANGMGIGNAFFFERLEYVEQARRSMSDVNWPHHVNWAFFPGPRTAARYNHVPAPQPTARSTLILGYSAATARNPDAASISIPYDFFHLP